MSLKSILHAIGEAVSNIWHHITPNLQTGLIIAENAVDALKKITSLDQGNVIGAMAGSGGIAVENKLREILPGIITDLKIASELIVPDNLDATLYNISRKITFTKNEEWDRFWHDLALKVSLAMTDGKITFGELVHLVEFIHTEKPKVTNG